MSFISKTHLIPILSAHGYEVKTEDDIPDTMFNLFQSKIEEQLREAIKVALISADNANRKELQEPEDIDSIVAQLNIFTKPDGGSLKK